MLAVIMLAGCGGGDFKTAPVQGVVKCHGTLLTSGVVYFAPIGQAGEQLAGKSGGGVVGPDGRFEVSTYEEGDGAVVGKHRVVWQAEDEHADRSGPSCSRTAFAIVEVPDGGIRDLVVDLQEPEK